MFVLSARRSFFLACVSLLALLGCSRGPERLEPTTIRSGAAAKAAISQYDTDGDGAISITELDHAPALKSALKSLDTDGDQKITAAEIAAQIDRWREDRVALKELKCRVLLAGRPLAGAGAVVTRVPEKWLADSIHPATGTTDRSGKATLCVAKEFLPNPAISGVECGLYTVTITHPSKKIPAKYNTNTTLGCQVALASSGGDRSLEFKLSR